MHWLLIAASLLVLLSIVKNLKLLYPYFLNKVKAHIYFFFIFMIFILVIRAIVFLIMFIDSLHVIDITNSLSQIIYLAITEIIPWVVVSFSLLARSFRSDSVTFSEDTPSKNIQSGDLTINQSLSQHFVDEHHKDQEIIRISEQADIE